MFLYPFLEEESSMVFLKILDVLTCFLLMFSSLFFRSTNALEQVETEADVLS